MRIPFVSIIILFLISLLVDFWIWLDFRKFSTKKWMPKAYAVSAVACWVLLIVTLCLPRRDSDSGILSVMWLLYTYCTIYVAKIIYVIFSLFGCLPLLWKKKRVNTGLWIGMPIGVLVFAIAWWGALVGRKEIEINNVEIVSSKLPSSFNGYRIVQFSDAHVGTWGTDTTFISDFVNTINNEHPDLIVFTGDIVNRETSELKPFLKVMSRLKAKDGVISVLGNHDYGDYITWTDPSLREKNNAQLASWQKEMGWNLLNNRAVSVKRDNDSIMVIGVENWGEPPFRQYGKLSKAYPGEKASSLGLNDDRFKILLSHNPEHWRLEVTKESNIDLTLSGHTHAMQFMITIGNFRWSPSQYRYQNWAGLYTANAKDGNEMNLYVNVGSGEVGLPFRIGAVPEITVITLKTNE